MSETRTRLIPRRGDSTRTPRPGTARLVDRLGPFRVLRLLGRGGMGEVYLAIAPGGRPVALKVLSATATDTAALLRFRREAQVLEGLTHPQIVGVLAHGVDPRCGRAYLALELVEGRDLGELLADRDDPRLTPDEAVWVLARVARALAAVHRRGVVHRDVKPSNVLVTPTGEVKLGDFGIALSLEERVRLTRPGGLIGTPFFIAPEVARHGDWSRAADLYALGALAYRALLGPCAPLVSSTTTPLEVCTLLPSLAPAALAEADEVPEALAELIAGLLAADPAARPAAATVAEELSAMARDAAPPPQLCADAAASGALPPAEHGSSSLIATAATETRLDGAPRARPEPPTPPPAAGWCAVLRGAARGLATLARALRAEAPPGRAAGAITGR